MSPFLYQKKRSIISVKHDVIHRRESPSQSLSDGVKNMTAELAVNGMSPFQILVQIRKNLNVQLYIRISVIPGLLSCLQNLCDIKIQGYLLSCIFENVTRWKN